MRWLLLWVVILAPIATLSAHPVPKNHHDRTIVVHLLPGAKPDQVLVRVAYRLEVDETTVILDDMRPFKNDVDFTTFKKAIDYYAEYTRIYGKILADKLDLRVNGKAFPFQCVQRSQTLEDETGKGLGHLRCDFVFEAEASIATTQENTLKFWEGNYVLENGKIDVTFVADAAFQIIGKEAPDAALRSKKETDRTPGDDAKLRKILVRFARLQNSAQEPEPTTSVEPSLPSSRTETHESGLLRLFWESGHSIWILPILAFWFGAAHALTPGHGKTLVAAYLVGQNGTVWHALILGLVTTFTHTSVVFALAVALILMPEGIRPTIESGLELFMGLLILCLGFYLLLQRLSGRADHIHIGGGHDHDHQHGGGHHHHHVPAPGTVTAWGLVTLGITGGLVPCWDAVAMLMVAVGKNQLDLAIPLLLAFSLGLAGILVLIGILVVKVRRFTDSRLGEGRIVRALPIVSALFIQAMGFWLCYEAVHRT